MLLVYPTALVALLPLLAGALWFGRRAAGARFGLPGDWPRAIAGHLRALMIRGAVRGTTPEILLAAAIGVLVVLAIARPTIPLDRTEAFTNIAGRVIALDLGGDIDIHSQRHAVRTLMEDAPGIPTALVVATAEAFDVVPLTTDADFIERYLNVISPDVMPLGGRSVAVALTHSEDVLASAGIVAGQVILVTGGRAPDADARPATEWHRAVIVPEQAQGDWKGFADQIDARLRSYDDVGDVSREFLRTVERVILNGDPDSHFEITPYLIGLAAILWLALFRRRKAL